MRAAIRTRNWACAVTFMRLLYLIVFILSALLTNGCRKSEGTILGKTPEGKPVSILSVRAGTTPPKVVLDGMLVEKCPTAGCWFRLRDGSGVIKVDTKSAAFVVVNVPLQTRVTVAGTVIPDGNDVQIEATGIRY